ncbi:uncharacterized protein LOC143303958 [Bombus vancouverensis nearcticus]|uniref:uncharacterized protein LOC143303957 n=1 Tax=Bombus vancouverensis nearcticus TaxID=2705178 RepID=UPI00402B10A4
MDMEPALLLRIIATLFPPQEDRAAERPRETTRTLEWTEGRLGSHRGRDMGGDQKNGLPRRGAGPGRNLWSDLGRSDGSHGPQTSAPLHKMPERGSLPPDMADGEAGLARPMHKHDTE